MLFQFRRYTFYTIHIDKSHFETSEILFKSFGNILGTIYTLDKLK